MQNVMHIATNAGHTVQNDGRTGRNVGHNTLNVCQGLKGGLEELLKCFGIFKGKKYTFFQKCSKIGLVAKKLISLFLGEGVRTQGDKNHFF